MDMHPIVGSSQLTAYGWEVVRPVGVGGKLGVFVARRVPVVGLLALEFRSSGEVWYYAGVPERMFEAFLLAESKGGFFKRWIRRNFKATKAEGA